MSTATAEMIIVRCPLGHATEVAAPAGTQVNVCCRKCKRPWVVVVR